MHIVTSEANRSQTRMLSMERLGRVAAVVGCGLLAGITIPAACAQKPVTPPELTPPPGNVLFLATHATGTQNYVCEPAENGKGSWIFFSPQATLSVPLTGAFLHQTATHFLSPVPDAIPTPPGCTQSTATGAVSCPTWQSSLDSSAVWGGKVGSIDAGSDPSCPNKGSIPCLLLNAVATRPADGNFGLLGKTTFIQRLDTNGGAAPSGACTVGDQALVPYSADYFFYAADQDSLGKGQDEDRHRGF